MHVLVLLVLQLQRHDRQTVEEDDEIDLLVRLAEVEVWPERDAVLLDLLRGSALQRARFGIIETKLQTSHWQSVAQKHPERRELQLVPQGAKHFLTRVGSVIIRQFLERDGLSGVEKGPKLIFGDEVLGVRDVGLFEHAVLVFADKVVREMLLKS